MKIIKTAISPLAGVVLAALFLAQWVRAADCYWVNPGDGDFFTAGNWNPSVPGMNDSAFFTNNATYLVSFSRDATNANACFNASAGTVSNWIRLGNPQTWFITNCYAVGQDAGATAVVEITAGTLAVTNSAGTARLVVGAAGNGLLRLNSSYATITADRIEATNGPSPILWLNDGTLNTLHGSEIRIGSANFPIGGTNSARTCWNILGGTNIIEAAATYIGAVNYYYPATVAISGPGTILTNTGQLFVGRHNAGGGTDMLIVSNGAAVYSGYGAVGYATVSAATIDGSNSCWCLSGQLMVGDYACNCRVVITNGGMVVSAQGRIGYRNTGITNNSVEVTGAGSCWTNTEVIVGYMANASGNRLVVTNGGTVLCSGLLVIGYNAGANSNQAVVTGSNSLLRIVNAYIGESGSSNSLEVSDAATLRAENTVTIGNSASSSNNQLRIRGGNVCITNAALSALLDVRRGTLALEGSGGVCLVDRLNLNTAPATLKFTPGYPGPTFLTVRSNLTINAASAALVVDISAYHGPSIPLVSYGQLPVAFTNTTIIGAGLRTVWLDQLTDNCITLRLAAGTVIMIK